MSKVYKIKVIPNSKLNKIVEQTDDSLKVKLTAPPVDGKANKALVEFLSSEWGIPKSKIEILYGQTNRNKIVEVSD